MLTAGLTLEKSQTRWQTSDTAQSRRADHPRSDGDDRQPWTEPIEARGKQQDGDDQPSRAADEQPEISPLERCDSVHAVTRTSCPDRLDLTGLIQDHTRQRPASTRVVKW